MGCVAKTAFSRFRCCDDPATGIFDSDWRNGVVFAEGLGVSPGNTTEEKNGRRALLLLLMSNCYFRLFFDRNSEILEVGNGWLECESRLRLTASLLLFLFILIAM